MCYYCIQVAVSPESLYVMVMMTVEMGLMKWRLTCIVMNAHVILQSLNALTLQDASWCLLYVMVIMTAVMLLMNTQERAVY